MNTKSGKTIWIAISVFICFIGLALFQQKHSANAGLSDKETTASTAVPQENKVPVKLAPVTRRKFLKTINAYGKVESYQSAIVSPKTSGIVENIYVDEGTPVEKGKTILFQIDNIKLKQKVDNARQNISIVRAVEKERKALLRKAEIDFEKKSRSFNRYKSLYNKHAVSKEVFDTQEADYLTASAEVEHKKAILELGQAEANQAVINLRMTEKDLADSIVLAPIDGYISEKHIEIGEMGQPGKPAFKIDNTTKLLVSAYIPAEYSSWIKPEITEAEISLYSETLPTKLKVTYSSPVIDPKMHIFEIKCLIEENNFNLKPGQSVQIKLFIDEHSTVTVPTAALLENNNEYAIFTCENELAKRIVVKKGDEFDGWTEIVGSGLAVGSKVISEGQFLIKDNSPVTIVE